MSCDEICMSDCEIFFRGNENFLEYFAYKSVYLIRYKWHNDKIKKERMRERVRKKENTFDDKD